jgi:hypothetical protein
VRCPRSGRVGWWDEAEEEEGDEGEMKVRETAARRAAELEGDMLARRRGRVRRIAHADRSMKEETTEGSRKLDGEQAGPTTGVDELSARCKAREGVYSGLHRDSGKREKRLRDYGL